MKTYILGPYGLIGSVVCQYLSVRGFQYESVGRDRFCEFLKSIEPSSVVVNCSSMSLAELDLLSKGLARSKGSRLLHCSTSAISRGDPYSVRKENEETLMTIYEEIDSRIFRLGVPYTFEREAITFLGYWETLKLKKIKGRYRLFSIGDAKVSNICDFCDWIWANISSPIETRTCMCDESAIIVRELPLKFLLNYLPLKRLNAILGSLFGIGVII